MKNHEPAPHLLDLPCKHILPPEHANLEFVQLTVDPALWNDDGSGLQVRGLTDISAEEQGQRFLARFNAQRRLEALGVYLGHPAHQHWMPVCWVLVRDERGIWLLPTPRAQLEAA